MFGLVLLAVEAIDQAVIAKRRIDAGNDTSFYRGKLLNLEFYVSSVLPQAIALGKCVQSGDETCLSADLFE